MSLDTFLGFVFLLKIFKFLFFSSPGPLGPGEVMPWRVVRRPSVCPSVRPLDFSHFRLLLPNHQSD